MVVYGWLSFYKKFVVGSVLAALHDIIVTVGVFAVFGIEFDLTVLAAVLAVLGYSLNDTIVVFDRIFENFLLCRTGTPEQVIDDAINQTLSRTLINNGARAMAAIGMRPMSAPAYASPWLDLIGWSCRSPKMPSDANRPQPLTTI